MFRNRRKLACSLLFVVAAPTALHAATRVRLHDGWRLQSACKLHVDGKVLSRPGFSVDDWIATSVPSTVLAAQAAAGAVPDPYYGDNLRKLPGGGDVLWHFFANQPMPAGSPYRCGWWYRDAFDAPAANARNMHLWLRFSGINYSADIWLNGKKIAGRSSLAGAYRTYLFDVTGVLKPGESNVLAVETFAPTEKDLAINWVDWNPAPPDKNMGLWGAVDLEVTGPVTLQSPLAVTHFKDASLRAADLTLYAELHNASGVMVKGIVSGTAAGEQFQQPVELAAHEDRTVIFTP
jgi:exo-1,4-beta-D-glucosaminidase